MSVVPSVAGLVVISQKQSNEAESAAAADPLSDTSPPQANRMIMISEIIGSA